MPDNNNALAPMEPGAVAPATAMDIEQSRAMQEVQAAMIVAKRFPRDEVRALNRIMQDCKRPGLAEAAEYAYPRGDTLVSGPSIRLAEAMARHWGNLDYGVRELSRGPASSTWEAHCWDQETNTRSTKTFEVPHRRHTRNGDYALTDPRDIYELGANLAGRRLRACILAVIPGYVAEEACKACQKTLSGPSQGPIQDRLAKMVQAFSEFGVTQEMIEARLGHNLAAVVEPELAQLRKIFRSIKDAMSKREDWFDLTAAGTASQAEELKQRLAEQQAKAKGKKADQAAPPEPAQEQPQETQSEQNIRSELVDGIGQCLGELDTYDNLSEVMLAVNLHLTTDELLMLSDAVKAKPADVSLVEKAIKAAKKGSKEAKK